MTSTVWRTTLFLCLAAIVSSRGIPSEDNGLSQWIIGGDPATYGDNPYMVSVQTQWGGEMGAWSHSCGGAIISSRTIVTAAHCVDLVQGSANVRIVAGLYHQGNSADQDQFKQIVPVQKIIVAPGYDADDPAVPHDIAILQLNSSLSFNSHVNTVPLPSDNQDFNGEVCNFVGWGLTSPDSDTHSDVLMKLDLHVIDNQRCNSYYGSVLDSHICTYQPPKGTCRMDSGGPMVCSGVLAGVLSFGEGHCNTNFPDVLTRVSSYKSWIQANTI